MKSDQFIVHLTHWQCNRVVTRKNISGFNDHSKIKMFPYISGQHVHVQRRWQWCGLSAWITEHILHTCRAKLKNTDLYLSEMFEIFLKIWPRLERKNLPVASACLDLLTTLIFRNIIWIPSSTDRWLWFALNFSWKNFTKRSWPRMEPIR